MDQAVVFAWDRILLWGFAATAVLTIVLQGSQGLGLSRLSLPFLIGTLFSGRRARASVVGFLVYLLGGWGFAFLYVLLLADLGGSPAWAGALIGLMHALFLLVVVLPLLPLVHPRMASEYDSPTPVRRLEPPGFLGLNYGYRTPLTTMAGHVLYGGILGAAF
jgi:uncharacterized membrane protein YagU involved in acid resistance